MLRDSAHIQESEAEWKNRKNARAGLPPVEPDYTVEDAETAVNLFVGVDYDKRVELAPGVEARFTDVGHLLGSASIELWVTEGEKTTKLVFSGDIGNLNQPILKDPTYLTEADYVIMESTYGDRSHPPRPTTSKSWWMFCSAPLTGRQRGHPQLCSGPHPGAALLHAGDQGEKPGDRPR